MRTRPAAEHLAGGQLHPTGVGAVAVNAAIVVDEEVAVSALMVLCVGDAMGIRGHRLRLDMEVGEGLVNAVLARQYRTDHFLARRARISATVKSGER